MVSLSIIGMTGWVNPFFWLFGALGPSPSYGEVWGRLFLWQTWGRYPAVGSTGGVFSRGRDATPEADETLLERREGTLRTAALFKVSRLL